MKDTQKKNWTHVADPRAPFISKHSGLSRRQAEKNDALLSYQCWKVVFSTCPDASQPPPFPPPQKKKKEREADKNKLAQTKRDWRQMFSSWERELDFSSDASTCANPKPILVSQCCVDVRMHYTSRFSSYANACVNPKNHFPSYA